MPRTNEPELTLRITVTDPPRGVRFRLQHGARELTPPTTTTKDAIIFEFPVRVGERPDGQPNFLGPYTQGPPAGRFVYINSGTYAGQTETCWARRAKVPLGGITRQLIHRALSESAPVEIEIGGTGRDGGPSCGTIRFPHSAWRVAPARKRGAR
jgi:hypothetical protein